MTEITELAEKLKTEGEKFVGIFSSLTDDQWNTEVYAEGELWTIRNVLSHFVTSERGLLRLFESIRQGGSGIGEDFSIDRYNAAQQEKTRDLSVTELLEKYKATRAETITWVAGLKESDLELAGRHPFLGETVLGEMVKAIYIHNQLHYRDFKKVLN